MKKNIKLLGLTLLMLSFISLNVEASSNPQRIFGNNRIETSVKVSQAAHTSSNAVILAGYDGQVDSLSGTILAHFKSAPMLLSKKDQLDGLVLKEIERLKATEVYILGGENSISKDVEDSLSKYKVTRIKGERREETAVNIAQEVLGNNIDQVFLTLGYEEYADALAIGPISGRDKKPILLTKTEKLSEDTKNALKDFNVKRATIIGGETVISKAVENELTSMNITVDRVFGNDRMETSLKIAKEFTPNPSSIILANGWKYADAVIGGYFAAKENAPIILSKDSLIDIKALDYIGTNKKKTYVLGGDRVIYKNVLEDMDYVLNGNIVIKDEMTNFDESSKLKNVLDRVYYKNGQVFRRQNIKAGSKEIDSFFIEGSTIAGETLKISVDAVNGENNLYRFYQRNLTTNKLTIIEDYSGKSTASWIPKTKGNYLYGVDIKAKNSKEDKDLSIDAPIKIEPSIPAELQTLDISGSNEAKTPHTIVANAKAVNGVLYKFYVKDESTGNWTMIQDYSENNRASWTPEKTGKYLYSVNVKDKKSWEDKEDQKSIAINIVPLKPAIIESLEISGPKYAKTKHTLTAQASSSNGALYKFYIKEEKTGNWTILQDYSEKNTVSWVPKEIGKYSYYVGVKDKRSDKDRDNLLSYPLTINPPAYYNVSNYSDTLEEALDKQVGKNKASNNFNVWATKEEIRPYFDPSRFLQFKPKAGDQHILSVEITGSGLNVRSQANTSSPSLTTVNKGSIYVVLDQKANWFKINAGGKEGWISGDFAKYTNTVPQAMYQFMVLNRPYGATAAELNLELKNKGILDGTGAAFIEAAKKYNVNELYLVAHALHETGNGSSKLAKGILVDTVDGKKVEPKLVYNMYGVAAYDNSAAKSGSEYGYKRGWFTPAKAVSDGAKWISDNYINSPKYKQDTLYKMKFNATVTWHQYATDVGWAMKQTNRIYKMVENCKNNEGILVKFDIPQYK